MDLNLKAICLYCNSDDNKMIKTVTSVQIVVQLFLFQALKLVMPSISVVVVRDASYYYNYQSPYTVCTSFVVQTYLNCS